MAVGCCIFKRRKRPLDKLTPDRSSGEQLNPKSKTRKWGCDKSKWDEWTDSQLANSWPVSAPVSMCGQSHFLLLPGSPPKAPWESPSQLKRLPCAPTASHGACLQKGYYCRLQLIFKSADSLIYLSACLSDKTLSGCADTACSSGCGTTVLYQLHFLIRVSSFKVVNLCVTGLCTSRVTTRSPSLRFHSAFPGWTNTIIRMLETWTIHRSVSGVLRKTGDCFQRGMTETAVRVCRDPLWIQIC